MCIICANALRAAALEVTLESHLAVETLALNKTPKAPCGAQRVEFLGGVSDGTLRCTLKVNARGQGTEGTLRCTTV